MSEQQLQNDAATPETAAVCGLYCEACSLYIANHQDPERLPALAARWGRPVEELRCDGCRAETRSFYCQTCTLFTCAAQRGHTFCNECADYPCGELDGFRKLAPHRAEIYESLQRISEVGVDAWLQEARQRYTCPACGTLNSAYDLKCYQCGHEPTSDYVTAHMQEILERLTEMQRAATKADAG